MVKGQHFIIHLFYTFLLIAAPLALQGQFFSLKSQAAVDAFDPTITSITGDLEIGGDASSGITDLTPLSNLQVIGGDLRITSNDVLTNLNGLQNITSVNRLSILSNRVLPNLNGLNVIDIADDLYVRNNRELVDIAGLLSLTNVPGDIDFTGNDILTNIDGLCNLSSVGGAIMIVQNNAITNLDGFKNVTSILDMNILYNPNLTNLDGLANIQSGRGIFIAWNDILSDCCGVYDLIVGGQVDGIGLNNPQEPCQTVNAVLIDCGFQFIVTTNDPCIGENNGTIQVNVTSDMVYPISYEWTRKEDGFTSSGVTNDPDFTLSDLPEGCYGLTLYSSDPDTTMRDSINLTSVNGNIFEIIEVNSTNSSNSLPNGVVSLTLSGGNPPFMVQYNGPVSGNLDQLTSDTIRLNSLTAGEYNIAIFDSQGKNALVSLTLLDDVVPVIPCDEPMDIVILNDVSGSVDEIEYAESKQFFVDFVNAINIGSGINDSRAAIVEWHSGSQIVVPMTDELTQLDGYLNTARIGSNSTEPLEAMIFAKNYLDGISRPNATKVIVLSTDAGFQQLPPALIVLADEMKAEGIFIVTIAFDNAFAFPPSREVLQEIATADALAPGAPAYSQLTQDLASNIVDLFLCPISPGEFATAYFYRDGEIEITNITFDGCPFPDFVDIEITISAYYDLAIPSGTPVSFYTNDPEGTAGNYLLTWTLPCSLPAGDQESFTITLPATGPGNIFAVLNDNGGSTPPIDFPITDIQELAYSNNIDNASYCADAPTINVIKYTTTPNPVCGDQITYVLDICNVSEIDARNISVTDEVPAGFVLKGKTFSSNGCGIVDNDTYDLPGSCCITLTLDYDASAADLGTYDDQDAFLEGPSNQDYIDYEGAASDGEDIVIDGTIDCPSTVISFSKEVSTDNTCDDNFVTYTFTIGNETIVPLRGLTFRDTLPSPSYWVFEPYAVDGMTITSSTIENNIVTVEIDKVNSVTAASFKLDVQLATWQADGDLINTAFLERVPDFDAGDLTTLQSNQTQTAIRTAPEIIVVDTIWVDVSRKEIELDAIVDQSAIPEWTTAGDGVFSDANSLSTIYQVGLQDSIAGEVLLVIDAMTDCHQVNESVIIIFSECAPQMTLLVSDCLDNNTPIDPSDDTFFVDFSGLTNINGVEYRLEVDGVDEGTFVYGSDFNLELPANGMDIILVFTDVDNRDCSVEHIVNQASCSASCQLALSQISSSLCDDAGTPADPTDDTYDLVVNVSAINPGISQNFEISVSGNLLGSYTYEVEHTFSLPALGLTEDIVIRDVDFSDCELRTSIATPASCSDVCLVEITEWEVSLCDNNMTLSDDSDDTYSVVFAVSKINSLETSEYTVTAGQIQFGPFSYDVSNTLELPADGQDYALVFEDATIDCGRVERVVEQESCSEGCELILDLFERSECDDNGTPEDITDDSLTVTIRVMASEGMLSSNYQMILDDQQVYDFQYGLEYELTVAADGTQHTFRFEDVIESACDLRQELYQEHCSFVKIPKVYIPDVFVSSFNDGNENWKVVAVDEAISFIKCQIYDRWGSLIFSSDEEREISWDGTKGGLSVEQGAYTYFLEYSVEGQLELEIGTLIYLR